MFLHDLDALIREVCPIIGLKDTAIIFEESATTEEREAARAIFDEHIASVIGV